MNEILERRLEFLKLEAKGFSLCEIVKVLSEKYQTSERNIYYDAETRDTWQPVLTQLFDLDKARLIVINRYDLPLPSSKPSLSNRKRSPKTSLPL